MIDQVTEAAGEPVAVRCAATNPPVGLLRRAGADALSLDASGFDAVSGVLADDLGEAWDQGTALVLGLVPNAEPDAEPTVRELARPAFDFASRLGFSRRELARRALVAPTGGLADASASWARRALRLCRQLTEMFAEEAGD